MSRLNGTKVITNKVRLSYVYVLEPHAFEGQEPKYSVMLLIPKSDKETLGHMQGAIEAAHSAAKSDKLKGVSLNEVKTTLRDGDDEFDTAAYPEYAGMMFMNVSCKTKPQVVKRDNGLLVETENPNEIYSGVYALVSLNFFAYNRAGNKGVTAGLNHIWTLCNGDFLGGKANAETDFGEVDWFEEEREGAEGYVDEAMFG